MPFMSTVGGLSNTSPPGTFRFLPPFSQDEIYDRSLTFIGQGLSPLRRARSPQRSMRDLLVVLKAALLP